MYADFEALIKNEDDSENGIQQIDNISGWSICVKSPYEKDIRRSSRGDNAGQLFIGNLQSLGKELKKKIGDANAKMIYGEKEKGEFENAKKCHICECDIKKNKIDHLGNIQKMLARYEVTQ